MTSPTNQALTILLAEDDEGHAELVRLSLKRANVINEIVHVTDGQAALDYLRREGLHRDRPPSNLLVLLDIKMPGMDGIEALQQIKSDARLAKIPVIMLTTTDDPREIERCYQLGCSVYITKPVVFERFHEALRELGVFLQFICVPTESPA